MIITLILASCASDSNALDDISEPVSEDGLNEASDNELASDDQAFNNTLYNNLAVDDSESEDGADSSDNNLQSDDYALEEGNDLYANQESDYAADDSYNYSNQAGYDEQEFSDANSQDYADNELALSENDSYDDIYQQDLSNDTTENTDSSLDDGYENLASTEESYANSYSEGLEGADPYDLANQELGSLETTDDMTASNDITAQSFSQLNLPELGSKMSYIVQSGDTLAKISTKIYGSSDFWQEISQLSGLENPNLIYPGNVLYYRLTEQSQAFAAAYENTPKGEIMVQSSDTLSTIASKVYGDYNQWQSIWRTNDHIDNPDKLTVGQTLYFIDQGSVLANIDKWKNYFKNLDIETANNTKQKSDDSGIKPTSIESSVKSVVGLLFIDSNSFVS